MNQSPNIVYGEFLSVAKFTSFHGRLFSQVKSSNLGQIDSVSCMEFLRFSSHILCSVIYTSLSYTFFTFINHFSEVPVYVYPFQFKTA